MGYFIINSALLGTITLQWVFFRVECCQIHVRKFRGGCLIYKISFMFNKLWNT